MPLTAVFSDLQQQHLPPGTLLLAALSTGLGAHPRLPLLLPATPYRRAQHTAWLQVRLLQGDRLDSTRYVAGCSQHNAGCCMNSMGHGCQSCWALSNCATVCMCIFGQAELPCAELQVPLRSSSATLLNVEGQSIYHSAPFCLYA